MNITSNIVYHLKKSFNEKSEDILLARRFKQVATISLITMILGIAIFVSQLEEKNSSQDKITLLLLIILTITNITSLTLTKSRIHLAIDIFLWCLAIITVGLLWIGGGIRDSTITSYPVILVLSALLGSLRSFIGISTFLIAMAILLTVAEAYDINPYPARSFNQVQTLYIAIITTASCFIIGTFNMDFKQALRKLQAENEHVRQSQEETNHLAYHDPLTGLLRRSAGAEQYQRMLHETDLTQNYLFLYFLDLDNFKNINDSFDHSAGDTLLVTVSQRLSALLETNDAISRVGGDEFLIMMVRPKQFNSQSFAEKILRQVPLPVILHGTEVDVTVSIGIAVVPRDGRQFEDVRKRADLALYKAKQQGKNTFHYYGDALHQATVRKTLIISTLKRAVKSNLLELYFQPKVNITTGAIIGAEALLRWVKDNPYKVEPSEFIPLIESTDIIIEVGQWVIKQACICCRRWHDMGYSSLSVAVNISGMQLARHNLKATIDSALEHAGLSAQFLQIELTEHLLITGSNAVLNQLDDIKALGIDLAIDDFGTGYSSLSYLTNLEVDALKLDKSFISGMTNSTESLAIVKAIISMANIIGISTIAEGVETEKELAILQELGCQYGQGYLWGQPMSENKLISLIEKKQKILLPSLKEPALLL